MIRRLVDMQWPVISTLKDQSNENSYPTAVSLDLDGTIAKDIRAICRSHGVARCRKSSHNLIEKSICERIGNACGSDGKGIHKF